MVLRAVYQRPREKKPSSASTRITIRMIQRMLMRFDASLRGEVVDLLSFSPRRGNEKPGRAGAEWLLAATQVAQKIA
jgi:hypothetical protein